MGCGGDRSCAALLGRLGVVVMGSVSNCSVEPKRRGSCPGEGCCAAGPRSAGSCCLPMIRPTLPCAGVCGALMRVPIGRIAAGLFERAAPAEP